MDRPKFKIGETARLVGLSPETIRYYEKKQIIRPRKESGSGYRQFDILDVCILSKARAYLHYGFSLEEAQELLCASSTDDILLRLETQERTVEEHIAAEQAKLLSLQRKISDLHDLLANIGKFSIRKRPALLCCPVFEDRRPIKGQPFPPPLAENQIFTFPYLEFSLKNGSYTCPDTYRVGMAIRADDAAHLDPNVVKQLRFLPEVPCLYTALTMCTSDHYARVLQASLDHLARKSVTPRGNIICRTVTVHRENAAYRYYRDAWIPIPEGALLD